MADLTPPPYLMTSDPGSFARSTIIERKPKIIHQVITQNAYSPEVITALDNLREEIASGILKPLHESSEDVTLWNFELSAFYAGKTWLEIPWYFAEAFFYRRVLEAVRYFQPGENFRRDPFTGQKQRQIVNDIQKLADEWEALITLEPQARFVATLHSCLWGNRTDLSNFTVKEKGRMASKVHEDSHLILIDHTTQIMDLLSMGVRRVDFICDNVGSDLLFDLALADFLLARGWVKEIHLNLKNQPFFVSDAMPEDAVYTIEQIQNDPAIGMQDWGRRLQRCRDNGSLFLDTDPFWTGCLMFRQMPEPLREQLANSSLVVIKGDVNYRRLLDDRHWPHTTRMEAVCHYFPAPFVALRTLKGEIMVGLKEGQAETLEGEDPGWLINGKRGVVQLVTP